MKARFLAFLLPGVIFLTCVPKEFSGRKYSQIEKKAPGWLDGSSRNFPVEKYFVGVGVSSEGRDMDKKLLASKDVARAEIAKIFKVKIESVSEETLHGTLTGRGKYSSPEIRETYNSFVRASTDMVVEGVEINDSYKNSRGEVYTLAVLDKKKALNLFREKIEKKLSEIKGQTNEAALAVAEKKHLLGIKFNRQALLTGFEIEILNTQIIVAGGNPVDLSPEYTPGFIKIKIDRLFSAVSIAIDGEKNAVQSHVMEVLTHLGFRVKKNSNDTDFLIRCGYSFYDDGSINISEDYIAFRARSNLSLEFFQRGNEKVIGKVNLEAKGVGKTADLAAKHSIDKLSDTVRSELVGAIFRFL